MLGGGEKGPKQQKQAMKGNISWRRQRGGTRAAARGQKRAECISWFNPKYVSYSTGKTRDLMEQRGGSLSLWVGAKGGRCLPLQQQG